MPVLPGTSPVAARWCPRHCEPPDSPNAMQLLSGQLLLPPPGVAAPAIRSPGWWPPADGQAEGLSLRGTLLPPRLSAQALLRLFRGCCGTPEPSPEVQWNAASAH